MIMEKKIWYEVKWEVCLLITQVDLYDITTVEPRYKEVGYNKTLL